VRGLRMPLGQCIVFMTSLPSAEGRGRWVEDQQKAAKRIAAGPSSLRPRVRGHSGSRLGQGLRSLFLHPQDIRETLLAGNLCKDAGALAGIAVAATMYPGAKP